MHGWSVEDPPRIRGLRDRAGCADSSLRQSRLLRWRRIACSTTVPGEVARRAVIQTGVSRSNDPVAQAAREHRPDDGTRAPVAPEREEGSCPTWQSRFVVIGEATDRAVARELMPSAGRCGCAGVRHTRVSRRSGSRGHGARPGCRPRFVTRPASRRPEGRHACYIAPMLMRIPRRCSAISSSARRRCSSESAA